MKSSHLNIPPEQIRHTLAQIMSLLKNVEPDINNQEQRFDIVRAKNALQHLQKQLQAGDVYVDADEMLLDWLQAVQPPRAQFMDDLDDAAALGTALQIYATDHGFFAEGFLERIDWAYIALQFQQDDPDTP